jgi:hypothetical protein
MNDETPSAETALLIKQILVFKEISELIKREDNWKQEPYVSFNRGQVLGLCDQAFRNYLEFEKGES